MTVLPTARRGLRSAASAVPVECEQHGLAHRPRLAGRRRRCRAAGWQRLATTSMQWLWLWLWQRQRQRLRLRL